MINLNQKQKIIIGIVAVMVIACVCYYVYSRDNSGLVIEQENFTENETNQTNENNGNDTTQESSTDSIFVHISGAVNKEGLIELPINSRISDAIEKAEGLKEDANLKNINLAYKLEDGMKIYIPNNEEEAELEKSGEESIVNQISEDSGYITSSTKNNISTSKENSKVNINTATQSELETLPGIGEATALKIIDYRKQNGNFKTIEDIKNVSGIGQAKYEKIRERITV